MGFLEAQDTGLLAKAKTWSYEGIKLRICCDRQMRSYGAEGPRRASRAQVGGGSRSVVQYGRHPYNIVTT